MRTIRVSVGSQTVSAPIPLDHYAAGTGVAIEVQLSAGANLTYKVQHTFDDVFAATFNPATATWVDHPTLTGLTATADGNYQFIPVACRLNVTAYTSGTATICVNQSGLQ